MEELKIPKHLKPKKGFFSDLLELRLFGLEIQPLPAVVAGIVTFLIPSNLGGTFQPIGCLLILFGGIKLVKQLISKKT